MVALAPPALDEIVIAQPSGLPVRVNVNKPFDVIGFPGSGCDEPVTVTVPLQSIPGVAMKYVPPGARS